MKVKTEHYIEIRDAMAGKLATVPPDHVAQWLVTLAADPKVRDVGKRARWDLFRAAIPPAWACQTLYPYLNDDHIDTALRAIAKEVGLCR